LKMNKSRWRKNIGPFPWVVKEGEGRKICVKFDRMNVKAKPFPRSPS